MSLPYKRIKIYTSEDVHWHGKVLYNAVIEYIRSLKLAARCIVTRGIAGLYENGEISTSNILDLSYNLPITIEVMIPAADIETILPRLEEMVVDGIIGIEDLGVYAYHSAKCLIPRQLKVKEVMTGSPKTVTPDTSIRVIIQLMSDEALKAVPVIDSAQHPLGIITPSDLTIKAGLPIRLGLFQKLDKSKVDSFIKGIEGKVAHEIMSTPLVTTKEEQSIKDVAQTMIRRHLKRLPVVNDSGVLVGIISRIDIFRIISKQAPQWRTLEDQNIVVNNTQSVSAIIQRDLATVFPETPIAEIVEKISAEEIQRIAVVDHHGKLIGLISDTDLMAIISGHPGFWDYMTSRLALPGKGRQFDDPVQHYHGQTAAEVMIKNPIVIKEETTIDEAVQLMAGKGLKRLPVIDSQGVFQGMISRDSVLQTCINKEGV